MRVTLSLAFAAAMALAALLALVSLQPTSAAPHLPSSLRALQPTHPLRYAAQVEQLDAGAADVDSGADLESAVEAEAEASVEEERPKALLSSGVWLHDPVDSRSLLQHTAEASHAADVDAGADAELEAEAETEAEVDAEAEAEGGPSGRVRGRVSIQLPKPKPAKGKQAKAAKGKNKGKGKSKGKGKGKAASRQRRGKTLRREADAQELLADRALVEADAGADADVEADAETEVDAEVDAGADADLDTLSELDADLALDAATELDLEMELGEDDGRHGLVTKGAPRAHYATLRLDNTWESSKRYCASVGAELCSSKQLCPGGSAKGPVGHEEVPYKRRSWAPVRDGVNFWMNLEPGEGTAAERCTVAQNPGWGSDPRTLADINVNWENHSKSLVACCDSSGVIQSKLRKGRKFPGTTPDDEEEGELQTRFPRLRIPAVVLGHSGVGPWGGVQAPLHQSAEWIWNHRDAVTGVEVEEPDRPLKFQLRYHADHAEKGKVVYVVDNSAEVFVNGKKVGSGAGGWNSAKMKPLEHSVSFRKGLNVVEFHCKNAGGPAGLIAAAFSLGGRKLWATGKGWFVDRLPRVDPEDERLGKLPRYNIPVVVLGHSGVGPWGGVKPPLHQAAEWIWNDPAGTRGVPVQAKPLVFQLRYTSPASVAGGKIVYVIDDRADVFLNGKQVGSGSGGWNSAGMSPITHAVTFRKGLNVIEFHCKNGGGPAGLIAAGFDDKGQRLWKTDASWTVDRRGG